MWIRQDWLDNLGLDTPTTVDEFYEVAKQFTEGDPDKNGQKDTFGVTFNYNFLGIAKALFGQPSEGVIITSDGKVDDWTGSQAYADCFTWLKSMYSNGLIDPEYITDSNYERQRQLLVTGKAGIYLSGWDQGSVWRELIQNVPDSNLVPLEPVASEYGKQGLYQEPPANRMICMNKDAKDPEAVMQFLDWVLTDGWYTLTYGIEGENYNLVDGVPQAIDADLNKEKLSYAYEYPIIMDQVIDDTSKYIEVTAAQDEVSQQYAKLRALSLETAMKNIFVRSVPYLPTSETASQFSTDFNPTLTSIETKMITDPNYSVEQGVAEVNKEKELLGYNLVLEERQEWYDANKDILGK